MKKVMLTICGALLGTLVASSALAVVPDLIPVQGVLTDDLGDPIDGSVEITFSLYDAETAGTQVWTETYTGADLVLVDEGFFTVYLGSITALNFSTLLSYGELWLGMTVAGDPEMSLVRFAAVPFAQEALTCQQVGSLTETDINNNFLPSTYAPAWGDLTGIPADIADGDQVGFTTEGDLTALLNDNYAASGHNHDAAYLPATYTPAWSDLTGVPAGFADGIDNDSGGDITGVTAGWGLSGGGVSGTPTITHQQTITACPSGYTMRGANVCVSNWRADPGGIIFHTAQEDCFDEGGHVCTYSEFHSMWVVNGYNPGFVNGDWIGDTVGDDSVLCVNNPGTSSNFEGVCNKTTLHAYRCCKGFGR